MSADSHRTLPDAAWRSPNSRCSTSERRWLGVTTTVVPAGVCVSRAKTSSRDISGNWATAGMDRNDSPAAATALGAPLLFDQLLLGLDLRPLIGGRSHSAEQGPRGSGDATA